MSSLEQTPQDNAETNKYFHYGKKCFKKLYKYSLGSFIHSIRCPGVGSHKCTCTYSLSETSEPGIEMTDFSNSKSHIEIIRIQERKECEYCMKEAVNHHYQDHLKKWLQYQKFPWKVVFHLLLILLVTAQVSWQWTQF